MSDILILINLFGLVALCCWGIHVVRKRLKAKKIAKEEVRNRRVAEQEYFNGQEKDSRIRQEESVSITKTEDVPADQDPEDEIIRRIIAGESFPEGTIIDHSLSFPSDVEYGDIILDGVIINGSVDMENINASGIVSFKRAVINGYFNIDDACAERFDLQEIFIAGDIYANCDARQGLYLSDSFVTEDFDVKGGQFSSDVILENINIGGGFLSEKCSYSAALVLSGAKIAQIFDLDGAELKSIIAEKIEVGGEAYLQNSSFAEASTFRGSIFKSDCWLHGAVFESDADFSEMDIGGGLDGEDGNDCLECGGIFNLSGSKIGASADLEGAVADVLDIRSSVIAKDLYLQNSEVKEKFLYAGAEIGGDMDMSKASIPTLEGLIVKGEITL